jgi:hypothetical protein
MTGRKELPIIHLEGKETYRDYEFPISDLGLDTSYPA